MSNLQSAKDSIWSLIGGERMTVNGTQYVVLPELSNQVITTESTVGKIFLNNSLQKKRFEAQMQIIW